MHIAHGAVGEYVDLRYYHGDYLRYGRAALARLRHREGTDGNARLPAWLVSTAFHGHAGRPCALRIVPLCAAF